MSCLRNAILHSNDLMACALRDGRIEVVKFCKTCGATDFDKAMREAAWGGHVEIVKLCKEWKERATESVLESCRGNQGNFERAAVGRVTL